MTLFAPGASWPDESHRLFAESAARFMTSEMVPQLERWRDQGIVDRAFWRAAGDAGLTGGSISEAYGGSADDFAYDAILVYEQTRTSGNWSWNYSVQSIVMHYLLRFGTEAQKQRFLPAMASGKWIGAIAMTEPGAGSDLQAVRTTATREGDSYILNGAKTFITNGQSADLMVVVARTEEAPGSKGISLIIVETGDDPPGFVRGQNLKKIGLQGSDTCELFFENVRVPQANLLGEEGRGFRQLMQQLPWERMLIGITALAATDFALAETLSYVKTRKAFNQRLMDFQNTRFKLAEAQTKAEVLRCFINDALARLREGRLDAATASMAKFWGSQVQNEVVSECVQLHGGMGYMQETPIAQLYADSRVQMIYGGSNEIMKELIARSLDAKGHPPP